MKELGQEPEAELQHAERFNFYREGDTIVVNEHLAIKYVVNRRGVFIFAVLKPLKIARNSQLQDENFSYVDPDGPIKFLKNELRYDPKTSINVGVNFDQYRVSLADRNRSRTIITVQSSQPIVAQLLRNILDMTKLFTREPNKITTN